MLGFIWIQIPFPGAFYLGFDDSFYSISGYEKQHREKKRLIQGWLAWHRGRPDYV